MIETYDHFLNQMDLHRIIQDTEDVQWRIQSGSGGGLDFLEYDVSDNDYYSVNIYGKIRKVLDKDYEIERIYFNGQWPSRDGEIHIDNCKRTVLLYVSPYTPEWGGFTQFVNDPMNQIIVPPIQNRLVIFDSSIPHKGYAFSNQNCPMRISLAYKLL